MKTTLDIPDATFRKAKTLAAAEGITLKQMVADALEAWMIKPKGVGSSATEPPWMGGFGELSDIRRESRRVMRLIEEEFEQVEPEDRA